MLGSACSRFKTKSHIMAIHPRHPDQVQLARIEYFVKLNIVDDRSNETKSEWAACITFSLNMTAKFGLVVPPKFGQDQLLQIPTSSA